MSYRLTEFPFRNRRPENDAIRDLASGYPIVHFLRLDFEEIHTDWLLQPSAKA